MAAGKINLQKASGGVTAITGVDGASNTNLVLPESGNLVSVDTSVTDNAIARFDGTTGKLQNSGVIIDAAGNLLLTSGTGVLGYGIGAGGTVTQLTNKNTAVTLNKPSGRIIMNNAALTAGASVDFVLYNSIIGTYDQLFINTIDGSVADPRVYRIRAGSVGSGFVWIRVTNESGGSLSEALQFTFSIIKGEIA